MAQRFVGVDLGTHGVKVAVLSVGLRSVQVLDAFEVPLDNDPQSSEAEAVETAVAALRQRGLTSEPVGVSLPTGFCRYRVLSFPFADERRIAQTVPFEAEGQFPVPLEQLSIDHMTVPEASEGGRALVIAARKDKLEQLGAVFRGAGVDVRAMTAGPLALAQALEVSVPPRVAGADNELVPVKLVVDVGHQFTECVAIGSKGPVGVRTIRRGGRHITEAIAASYRLDAAAAETAKHRDAFLPHAALADLTPPQQESSRIVASAVEPLLRQIEHTRLWLRATYRAEIVGLVLTGGGAELSGFSEYLSEQMSLPVESGNIKNAWLRGKRIEHVGRFAVAVGAAYGAARGPLVQLRDEVAGRTESGWLQERLPSLIGIGVAVLAFGALDTIAQLEAAEAELAAHEAELAQASLKVFGKSLTAQEVQAKMAAVEGEDMMSLIPERGALEVLQLITQAATPSDLAQNAAGPTMAPGLAAGPNGASDESGEDGEAPSDAGTAPDAGATATATSTGPVSLESGIVMADDLRIASLDIRERKIELKAEANNSSAQDRLNYKLRQIGCITNVTNGKVKGDTRRTFEMTMDNNCYFTSAEAAEAEAETSDDNNESEGEG